MCHTKNIFPRFTVLSRRNFDEFWTILELKIRRRGSMGIGQLVKIKANALWQRQVLLLVINITNIKSCLIYTERFPSSETLNHCNPS